MQNLDEKILGEINLEILKILQGNTPSPIVLPPGYPDNTLKILVDSLNGFIREFCDITYFVFDLAKGNLGVKPPKGNIKLLHQLKAHHSNLRHLTWQAQMIAKGDLNQQVDYLGDFADAFNTMSAQLKEAFERIELQKKVLVRANVALEELNHLDGLTGLYNRLWFDQTLEKEWKRARRNGNPLGLLMLDIDFFKLFNDNYGHPEGDTCIRLVSRIISGTARRPSDLCARYGGEEFTVILPHSTIEGVLTMGERIRLAVQELRIPHGFSGASPVVTVSIGAASMIPVEEAGQKTLVEMADKALYQAKSEGRNRVCCFNP
jgi:diguanylate cyclase (GGDEF)-like protein